MPRNRIDIIDSTLRDGQETLLGGRLRIEIVTPVLEALDAVGFNALEVWGGGTFQASLALLHEDPWDRLRTLRREVKRTPLQALLRGRFLVGDRPFSYGFVNRFLKHAAELGIDVVRLFEPLNNLASLAKVSQLAKRAGLSVQISLLSPYFVNDFTFSKLTQGSDFSNSDAIGIFDPIGTLRPTLAGDAASLLRDVYGGDVFIHVHDLDGAGVASILSACEAGASMVDACLSAFTCKGSLPSVEALATALGGRDRASGLKVVELFEAAREFWRLRDEYFAKVPSVTQPSDHYEKIIREMMPTSGLDPLLVRRSGRIQEERIRAETAGIIKDLGLVTLIAPLSEIIARQVILNLRAKKRYAQITDEFLRLLRGELGAIRIPPSLSRYVHESRSMRIPDEVLEEKVVPSPSRALFSEQDLLNCELFPQAREMLQLARENKLLQQKERIIAATIALLAEERLAEEPLSREPKLVTTLPQAASWRDSSRLDGSDSPRKRGFLEEPF